MYEISIPKGVTVAVPGGSGTGVRPYLGPIFFTFIQFLEKIRITSHHFSKDHYLENAGSATEQKRLLICTQLCDLCTRVLRPDH